MRIVKAICILSDGLFDGDQCECGFYPHITQSLQKNAGVSPTVICSELRIRGKRHVSYVLNDNFEFENRQGIPVLRLGPEPFGVWVTSLYAEANYDIGFSKIFFRFLIFANN